MSESPSISEILKDIQLEMDRRCTRRQARPMAGLFALRLVATVGFLLSVLGFLPGDLQSGLEFFVDLGCMVCLFALQSAHSQYRTGGIWLAVSLGVRIFSACLGSPTLWMVVAGLCVMVSQFLEYNAHGFVLDKFRSAIAQSWSNLCFWAFGAIFVGAFAFLITLTLSYVFPGLELLLLAISYGPDLLVDILYLIHLGRTIRLIQTRGE